MKDRSQSVNRFLARRELLEKIGLMTGEVTRRAVKSEKIRRQKSKRQKRAKVKYEGSEKINHEHKGNTEDT
jgi:hypothetical protein